MSIIKRVDKYWVDIGHNGQRIRKCSPESSRAGAMAYEAMLRQKLARGESIEVKIPDKVILLKEFADIWMRDYVAVNNKQSSISTKIMILRAHLISFFGNMPINQISNQSIEQYKAQKQKEKKANKTINNHLSVLRKMLTTAQDWDLLESVPRIKLLKVMPCGVDFLTIDECDQLMNVASGLWRDMILFVLKTGLRFGELVALKWEDVDFDGMQITVCRSIVRDIPQESTKGNKIRYVPIGDKIMQMLIRRHERPFGEYVFSNEDGEYLKCGRCIKTIIRIGKAAGLRSIGWHLLRHTFASHLSEGNVSPLYIQKLLGHSDIKTTMRYAHLGQQATREAIKVLDRPVILEERHIDDTTSEMPLTTKKPVQAFIAKIKQKQS